jgi:phosphoenolpyruvate phosphomutase
LYLASEASRSAVVLAATRGRGLEAITANRPKVMLPIAGKPLLRWLVDSFKKEDINNITVVAGYRADAIDTAGIKLAINERYAETGELASLACAVDFAYCSRPDDRGLFGSPVTLERIVSRQCANRQGHADGAVVDDAMGRWIGLLKVSRNGLIKLQAVMTRLRKQSDFDALDMPALMNALIADGAQIEVLYIHGHWRGVNDLEDLQRAVDFAYAQTPFGSAPEGTSTDADI